MGTSSSVKASTSPFRRPQMARRPGPWPTPEDTHRTWHGSWRVEVVGDIHRKDAPPGTNDALGSLDARELAPGDSLAPTRYHAEAGPCAERSGAPPRASAAGPGRATGSPRGIVTQPGTLGRNWGADNDSCFIGPFDHNCTAPFGESNAPAHPGERHEPSLPITSARIPWEVWESAGEELCFQRPGCVRLRVQLFRCLM